MNVKDASHAVEPGSISGSGSILTGTSVVGSRQSNVSELMSTTMERLKSSHSNLNVCSCYEANDKR